MNQLAGKVAVVTGGSSGIGLTSAEVLAKAGAHVYITGRRQKELDLAVKKIGKNVTGVQGDVSNLADLDKLYDIVKKQSGHIDILFANAGVAAWGKLGEITEEHYNSIFDINVKGVLFSVQKALPLFKNGGSIILNASIAGSSGMEAFSVYSATKAAVRLFARAWTADLKDRGIRVNAISPGYVPTPAYDNVGFTPEQRKELEKTIPLGRMGSTEDIANAVLFLASSQSNYVTGIDLVVDGGLTQV